MVCYGFNSSDLTSRVHRRRGRLQHLATSKMRVSSAVGRRLVAAAAAAAFAKLPVLPLLAGPDQFNLSALVVHAAYAAEKPTAANEYVDQEYGVSFVVPSGYVDRPPVPAPFDGLVSIARHTLCEWSPEESELSGGRKLLAATDPADTDFNLFVAFTPIRGDYTSLGSFGNIDFVGSTILPQVGQCLVPACTRPVCTLIRLLVFLVPQFQAFPDDYRSLDLRFEQSLRQCPFHPHFARAFAQCPNGACTLETDGIRGKMIAQSTGRGAYIFDYLIEQAEQIPQHSCVKSLAS
eukprot:2011929-Pleurochrysis_carterae.AAC.1